MQTNNRLNDFLTLLTKRNEHLHEINSAIENQEGPLRKEILTQYKRSERAIKHTQGKIQSGKMSENDKKDALKKFDKLLALKEKYNHMLHNHEAMLTYFRESIAKKNSKKKGNLKDSEWVASLATHMKAVEEIDASFLSSNKSALCDFLNKENPTLGDLDDYCVNPAFARAMPPAETKTGLMFALATMDAALTADYLMNVAAFTLPKPTTQKKTILHLQETMTNEALHPMLEKYHQEKKGNPVLAIAELIQDLRHYFVILPDAAINEDGLRALYHRECAVAGLTPVKIADFKITKASILAAHERFNHNQSSVAKIGMFSAENKADHHGKNEPTPGLNKK